MKDSYDVVVVGAGIVGTAIAYNLSQAGIQDVLVLEKNTVCSGDTAYSCAIVRTHYSNPLTCKMATIGRDVLADFPHRVGGESGFRRCGYLIFSGPDMLVEFEPLGGQIRCISGLQPHHWRIPGKRRSDGCMWSVGRRLKVRSSTPPIRAPAPWPDPGRPWRTYKVFRRLRQNIVRNS